MNIFYLHSDPKICAEQHNDKHVVKMILEYAQLMCTAHRVLDGFEVAELSEGGRRVKRWKLSDKNLDSLLYTATHPNHPSAKWVRHSEQNYRWLYAMWVNLLKEYTHRYGKVHQSEKLLEVLGNTPAKISCIVEFSPPWRAMPDEFKVSKADPEYTIKSYRAYYLGAKAAFSKWTKRSTPDWFATTI